MLDKRYVAGLFDGEGYAGISILKRETRYAQGYRIRVSLGSTTVEIPELLKEQYGGSVSDQIHREHPNWKPSRNWEIRDNKAIPFLREILPFLIIKRDVVKTLLDNLNILKAQDRVPGKLGWAKMNPDITQKRHEIYLRCKELNS